MVHSKTRCSTETNITIRTKLACLPFYALTEANFALSFPFHPLVSWEKAREMLFNLCCQKMFIRKSPTFPPQGEIANQLLCKVNLEQLLTLFSMMWGFLFDYKAVII